MIKLVFDAPLMSFGGPVASDRVGSTFHFPPKSMLTGLLGVAIGYKRSEHEKLQELQEGFTYGVREDRRGEVIEDFQTADFNSAWMTGYWEDGRYVSGKEARGRYGSSSENRSILDRKYIADAAYTVVLKLASLPEEKLIGALRRPKWPVYIGRKGCGAGFLRPERVGHHAVREALEDFDNLELQHPHPRPGQTQLRIWIEGQGSRSIQGLRDWASRIHAGKQRFAKGTIEGPPSEDPSL